MQVEPQTPNEFGQGSEMDGSRSAGIITLRDHYVEETSNQEESSTGMTGWTMDKDACWRSEWITKCTQFWGGDRDPVMDTRS